MTRSVIVACVLAGLAGSAQAATVEFRLVERQGRSSFTPDIVGFSNQLNFSVEARVVGGAVGESLGNFSFNLTSNEGDFNTNPTGTLFSQAAISTIAGQYDPTNYNDQASVGRGGLAHQYSYLAGINPNFNGLIDSSGGAWTESTTLADIGLVTGAPIGGPMLDLFSTNGNRPATQPSSLATTATMDVALAHQYLGATNVGGGDGDWIAIYNFNATLQSNATRAMVVTLGGVQAQTFTSWAKANGVWGPASPVNAQATGGAITIQILPAPGAAALLGLGGLVATRRRRN